MAALVFGTVLLDCLVKTILAALVFVTVLLDCLVKTVLYTKQHTKLIKSLVCFSPVSWFTIFNHV